MKAKITILFAICLFSVITNAQLPYTFSIHSSTYENIDHPTGLWENRKWNWLVNNNGMPTPLGFTYSFWGVTDTFAVVGNYGLVSFVARPHYHHFLYMSFTKTKSKTDATPWVSKIVYQTDGTPPNRIFKLEYNNVGFEQSTDTSHFANFQLWLYEGSNIFEVHYGASKTDSSCWFDNKGPYVGLDTNQKGGWFVRGNPQTATFDTGEARIHRFPDNGTVYRFTPIFTGIQKTLNINKNNIQVYPNPATDYLNIVNAKNTSYQITDMCGKEVKSTMQGNRIDISELSKGIYFLIMLDENKQSSMVKFIKQ